MDKTYSINEILEAVIELQNIDKKEKNKKKIIENKNSSVPINTLKLIEEAEKFKN